MIRPNNPAIDAAALSARVALETERLRAAAVAPVEPPRPAGDAAARLDLIAGALDAADALLRSARERNVPRDRLPTSLSRLGPLAAVLLRCYNTVFAERREVDADQNDALVALLHAMRELATVHYALLRELEAQRASSGAPPS